MSASTMYSFNRPHLIIKSSIAGRAHETDMSTACARKSTSSAMVRAHKKYARAHTRHARRHTHERCTDGVPLERRWPRTNDDSLEVGVLRAADAIGVLPHAEQDEEHARKIGWHGSVGELGQDQAHASHALRLRHSVYKSSGVSRHSQGAQETQFQYRVVLGHFGAEVGYFVLVDHYVIGAQRQLGN